MPFPVLTPDGERTGDEWLTTAEALRLTGIPRTRFRSWANNGKGPVHKRVTGMESLLWLRSSLVEMLSR